MAGIAASVWTALCLNRSIKTIPGFTGNVRVVTGASGGMVAAGYFVAALARPPLIATSDPSDDGDVDETEGRAGADAERKPAPLQFSAPVNPWLPQVNLVSDLANDVLTPVASHIALAGLPSLLWPGRARVNRGSVLEAAWERNTRRVARQAVCVVVDRGSPRVAPRTLIVTPTMVEEGRPLVVSNLDVESLDEIELFKLLPRAGRLPLIPVPRMNAAFPLVTLVAMLPTLPPTRVVYAGYVDNYGVTERRHPGYPRTETG